MTRFPMVFLAVALASVAVASDGYMDPPGIGTMAPAFGLRILVDSKGAPVRDSLTLDSICGTRAPEDTKLVLVSFLGGATGSADLSALSSVDRKLSGKGLRSIAIATDPDPSSLRAEAEKSPLGFPVLDDRYLVVARRYGVRNPPRTLVLDRDCTLLAARERGAADEQAALSSSLTAWLNGDRGL